MQAKAAAGHGNIHTLWVHEVDDAGVLEDIDFFDAWYGVHPQSLESVL